MRPLDRMFRPIRPWTWIALAALGCGGTSETPDPGSQTDSGSDAKDGADSDAGLAFGRCCAKPKDCASLRCVAIGDGPYFCSRGCEVYPDDCPVGFRCEGQVNACIPPSGDSSCVP